MLCTCMTGLSRSKRALQVFLVQAALLIQCLWRIWLLVLPYTYGEPTHGVDSAALYANSIVLLVQSLANPLTVAVVRIDCQIFHINMIYNVLIHSPP